MKKMFVESIFAIALCAVWAFAQTTAHQAGSAASQAGQAAGQAGTEAGQTASQAANAAGTGAGLTDSEMSSRVHQELMNDTDVGSSASHIHVSTKNGVVTLHGKVQTTTERDAAITKAKQIAGDANVKDELKVK